VLRANGIDPNRLRCNSRVRYGHDLYRHGKSAADAIAGAWGVEIDAAKRRAAARIVLGYLVRNTFETFEGDNLGVTALAGRQWTRGDARGPLLVFRTGTLPDAGAPDGCLADLLAHADVRHVVNLYAGAFPLHDWIAAEASLARARGATHYDAREHAPPKGEGWRELIEDEDRYQANRARAMVQVAELINTEILRPGGAPPRGNVLVHCGGGMHRTGMVMGVLQRCVNGASMEAIEAEYRVHTEYRSPEVPNGYEPGNLRFIADFDCGLINASAR